MPKFLVAIHHPDGYDPSVESEPMHRAIEQLNDDYDFAFESKSIAQMIDELNEDMATAGVRLFAGGLYPAGSARSLTASPGGEVAVADGPYLKTQEYVGGFWILECDNLDDAVEWGKKAVMACHAPVEVRQFH